MDYELRRAIRHHADEGSPNTAKRLAGLLRYRGVNEIREVYPQYGLLVTQSLIEQSDTILYDGLPLVQWCNNLLDEIRSNLYGTWDWTDEDDAGFPEAVVARADSLRTNYPFDIAGVAGNPRNFRPTYFSLRMNWFPTTGDDQFVLYVAADVDITWSATNEAEDFYAFLARTHDVCHYYIDAAAINRTLQTDVVTISLSLQPFTFNVGCSWDKASPREFPLKNELLISSQHYCSKVELEM